MIETVPPRQIIATKKITRIHVWTNASISRWSLLLIVAFQGILSWALLQNTAFQDEALYIYAGRQILQNWLFGQRLYDRYSYYFSGNPNVYPIIAGGLDMLGGLELARAFSLLCMLITTCCGYYVTKMLFGQRSAVFAALFFVCQGPVLFLSRLATYDPMCLCLIALATLVAVRSSSPSRRPWGALLLGPLLVLAFGTKYAALLFMPSVLAILGLNALLKRGWLSLLVRGSLGIISLVAMALVGAYLAIHYDPNMLHALAATTTNRIVIEVYSRKALLLHVIQMVGISYLIGIAGLFFARKKNVLLVLLFVGSALLVPAYHIYKAELISLDKHLGFSMFFLMPVAGYVLASLSGFHWRFSRGRYWLAGVAACLILFMVGAKEAQDMYSIWPASDQLSYVLNTQVRDNNGYYLAEQFEVSRYNLRADTQTWQWTGLDFFEYKDSLGRYYQGNEAYVQAIHNGYFALVQLNYGYNVPTAVLIAKAIADSKKYELIAKIPYRDYYGTGVYWVWRKR
ncbi:MAG TPA: glycosyltransferase family 39 protein [Ktedonobacteraceae bacterium]